MKDRNTAQIQTIHRVLTIACAASLPDFAPLPALDYDHRVGRPIPADIQEPDANKEFLKAHASVTRDYICLPSRSGFAWTFFGQQASLFNRANQQVTTSSSATIRSGAKRLASDGVSFLILKSTLLSIDWNRQRKPS